MATVVVGASQGLGEALCEVFHSRGHNVVAASRNTARLADMQARHHHSPLLRTFACDVTQLEEMRALMAYSAAPQEIGGTIAVLILCFGVNFDDLVKDWQDTDAFRRTIDTNLMGAANALHAAMPFFTRGSQIVVLSSLAGIIGCVPGGSAYAASKAGLDAMFTSCAPELKPLGISVLIVDPGSMQSDQPRQVLGGGTRYRAGRAAKTNAKPVAQVANTIYRAVEAKKSGRVWSTYRVLVLGALAVKYFLPSVMDRMALRVRAKHEPQQQSPPPLSNDTSRRHNHKYKDDDGVNLL